MYSYTGICMAFYTIHRPGRPASTEGITFMDGLEF